MAEFRIDEERPANVAVVLLRCQGTLDESAAKELDQAIVRVLERGTVNILIDLAEISYMTSIGVGVLLGAFKAIDDEGGKLVLLAPRHAVKMVLELMGVDRLIHIANEEQEALKQFGAGENGDGGP